MTDFYFTGGSLNPARPFGSFIVTGSLRYYQLEVLARSWDGGIACEWIYWLKEV
jgi:hypothetical protein